MMRRFWAFLLCMCICALPVCGMAETPGECWQVQFTLSDGYVEYNGELEIQTDGVSRVQLWLRLPALDIDHRLYMDESTIQYKLPGSKNWVMLMADESTPLTPENASAMLTSMLGIAEGTAIDPDVALNALASLMADVQSNPVLRMLVAKLVSTFDGGSPLHVSSTELGMFVDTLLLSISQDEAVGAFFQQLQLAVGIKEPGSIAPLLDELRMDYKYGLFSSPFVIDAVVGAEQATICVSQPESPASAVDFVISYPPGGNITLAVNEMRTRAGAQTVTRQLYAEFAPTPGGLLMEGHSVDPGNAFLGEIEALENSLKATLSIWEGTYSYETYQLALTYDIQNPAADQWAGHFEGSLAYIDEIDRGSGTISLVVDVKQSQVKDIEAPPEGATPLLVMPEMMGDLF